MILYHQRRKRKGFSRKGFWVWRKGGEKPFLEKPQNLSLRNLSSEENDWRTKKERREKDVVMEIPLDGLLKADTMMCRSMNHLSILVSIQFYPNYLITMTANIV